MNTNCQLLRPQDILLTTNQKAYLNTIKALQATQDYYAACSINGCIPQAPNLRCCASQESIKTHLKTN